jgi:hypothetical protein
VLCIANSSFPKINHTTVRTSPAVLCVLTTVACYSVVSTKIIHITIKCHVKYFLLFCADMFNILYCWPACFSVWIAREIYFCYKELQKLPSWTSQAGTTGIHRFINKIWYTESFLDKNSDTKFVLTGEEKKKKTELGAMIGWKRFLIIE